MSPLRRRLIEEVQLHRKAEATIEASVAAVADLAKFCRRSPDRFQRVRHYGFLANRGKAERLADIRRTLGVFERPRAVVERPVDWSGWLREVAGLEVLRCPRCGQELQREALPRPSQRLAVAPRSEPALPAPEDDDTS